MWNNQQLNHLEKERVNIRSVANSKDEVTFSNEPFLRWTASECVSAKWSAGFFCFFCCCGPSAKRFLHYFEKQIHKLTPWNLHRLCKQTERHMITCKNARMHAHTRIYTKSARLGNYRIQIHLHPFCSHGNDWNRIPSRTLEQRFFFFLFFCIFANKKIKDVGAKLESMLSVLF